MWGVNGNDIVWTPLRNPAYTAVMDPDNPSSGFHRSIVGNLDLTTDQIVAGATPGPTAPPQLWSFDGRTDLTPNFDGDADALNLVARFSEPVSWTATIADPGGAIVQTVTGSGDSAALGWVPLVGGVPVPDGTYAWAIHATDTLGSAPLDAGGPITVASSPPPSTGVLSLAPTTWMTNASTFTYNLVFAGPVTGLAANDFTVTGSASGCSVGAPVGSGANWTVPVGSCGTGWVTLSLEPGAVSDGTTTGPAGLIKAHWVIVDRSKPTTSAPRAGVRSNVTLVGGALQGSISWSASDSGSAGLRDYDVARSTDGGAFVVIKTGLTTPSLAVSLSSGHTYRFEVRAHDKANNVSAWVAGSTLRPAIVQQTSSSLTWAGAWTTTSSASYSGGSARYSGVAGASVTYAFSGRGIGVVFGRGPTRGQVKVYMDGAYLATVDTYAASASYGWVGFARNFSAYGSHTLKLVVVGTPTRPTVVLDALEVLR
jgi:hypothetical protein